MPDRTITGMIDGEKMHACKPSRDDRFDLLTDMRQSPEDTVIIPDENVLHIPGLGFDGVEGKSLLKIAAESWGLGKGAESRASSQLRRGYSGGIMLEAPAGMFRKEEDAKEFLEFFRKNHDGEHNAGKTGLLRDGVKANVLQMSNSDAQFIEQRRFQRQDAALWFLLEQILGDDSSVSYNSLEQKNLGYLSSCLMRWLCKWEEECNEKLLSQKEKDRDSHYFKFNVAALLRADYKTTIDSLSLAINARIMSPNEAREKLDMNSYEGGDEYANPAITPGQPGADQEEQDEPADDESDRQDNGRARLAAQEMVRSLLKREANDAVNGTNRGNFVAWIDRYYSRWEPKLADKLESIGLDRDLAREHCSQSIGYLLDASGKSTQENLKETVSEMVKDWPNRAAKILEELQ
jgi:HK97 family phage portal protein